MSNIVFSRRHFLATAALALPLGTMAKSGELTRALTPQQRQQLVFERRRAAAQTELNNAPPLPATNGDEERYLDRRASFSKTMPHNELGEVDATAYRGWLAILASGDPAQFEQVPRDPEAVERLNNPQATYAIDLVGPDATVLTLEPPPKFASQAMAAEMAELYWRALMRDVPFREYDSNPLVPAAIADLGALGYAQLSTTSLFRGETVGDRRGPLVSQFLWRDIPYGLQTIEQRYRVPQPGQDFLTTFDKWLDCQRGGRARAPTRFDPTSRYIASYRALVEYVHRDFSSLLGELRGPDALSERRLKDKLLAGCRPGYPMSLDTPEIHRRLAAVGENSRHSALGFSDTIVGARTKACSSLSEGTWEYGEAIDGNVAPFLEKSCHPSE